MSLISDYFKSVAKDINSLSTNMEKIEYLIELGSGLKSFPKEFKRGENRVQGCVSTAFIHVDIRKDIININGYSDALVINGYISVLINGLNGRTIEEFKEDGEKAIEEFVSKTNIKATLSPSRANAFSNIFDMVKSRIER